MRKEFLNAEDLARLIKGKLIRDVTTNIIGFGRGVAVFLYSSSRIYIIHDTTFGIATHYVELANAEFIDGDFDLDLSNYEIVYDSDILGYNCQDIVSGFEGIADVLIYCDGAETQVGLQPKATGNFSKLPDREYFDEPRIKIIN